MSSASSPDHMLQHVEHTDLIQAGLIPEFVGRLPVIISTQVRGKVTGRARQSCCSEASLSVWPICRSEPGTGNRRPEGTQGILKCAITLKSHAL